ncbi:ABC transporter permease [Sinomonas sp. ASV322]|uniref:ABC transporter permease n=1 Tax=Sinomonas sp. ASV322 TaxID=3041920 RepID=UPI0027DDAAF9|nr:ABC transporter permease [Sinomonas sp. ASV322]
MHEVLEPGAAPSPRRPRSVGERATAVRAWVRGAWDVVVLEAKQRLRSRGWYIMLAIWFALIAIVTWLTWAAWEAQHAVSRRYADYTPAGPLPSAGPGSMIFEAVLAFVMFFALVVSPALSANAVNGDRAQGTLAILQASLLRPGQILAGKLVAAWFAALAFLVAASPFLIIGVAAGGLSPGYIAVSLLMLAVELGVVSAIGTALSALAGRPLFSIVVTYLVVAMLCIGTLIAFGFGVALSRGTVEANSPSYATLSHPAVPGPSFAPSTGPSLAPSPGYSSNLKVTPAPMQGPPSYTCVGSLIDQPAVHTERVAWILSMNPFLVVADAIPYPDRSESSVPYPQGAIETMSQGARAAIAGPEATTPCANGKPKPAYLVQRTPLWPLGLGLQLLLAGGLLWGARQALVTPARRLARGTRVA